MTHTSVLNKITEKVLNFDVCEGINKKKEIKDVFVYHFRDKKKPTITSTEN